MKKLPVPPAGFTFERTGNCVHLRCDTCGIVVLTTNTNIHLAKHEAKMHRCDPKPYDVTGAIIAFESGELDTMGTLRLFAHLIKTGMAWKLQGSYGRAAAALIENGTISRDGTLHEVAA